VHTPARTRARERARQRGHPSPCRRVAPLHRATPGLTTAWRACRPYHAFVLVGRAVDALFARWHAHLSFRRLAGALSAAGDLCFPSDPRPRRRGLTPDKAALFSTLSVPLASLFTLRVLLCPTGAHTRPCEGRRRCARNRAAEPSSSPEALPLSRLRRRPSCSRRRGRATGTHPRQPGRRLPHLERNQSIQIATTSSLYFTSPLRTSFRPTGRTSVRPSQCTWSSTRTHAGEHPDVPPRSSPPWPSHRHACALK
jgi:hypothetical protein